MESKLLIINKTTTTTLINQVNGSSSVVIKKTMKREIVENGKTKEITTTVEEISGDNVDELLAKFDQLSSDKQSEIDENSNEIKTTIKKNGTTTEIESNLIKIETTGEQVNSETIECDKIKNKENLLVNDKENKSADQQIVKQNESINQVEQLIDLSDGKLYDCQKFNQQCLDKHNFYRSLHGVEPLTVNEKLNELAQDWANHLASIGSLSHRPKSNYGENVFWISIKDVDGNRPVDSWYHEIYKYNWDKATFVSGTGHFTQMIWKGSQRLGIGKSFSTKGTFVVCNYDPPGNIMGKFKENVLPLTEK